MVTTFSKKKMQRAVFHLAFRKAICCNCILVGAQIKFYRSFHLAFP